MRVATFNTELDRDGPGLLLRDVLSQNDKQVEAVAKIVSLTRPDVLVLQNVDYDHDLFALKALRDQISSFGHDFEYLFARAPNTGVAVALDVNGDGRIALPHDAQSFGAFEGQGGMALLSRYPIDEKGARDLSHVLWKDSPNSNLPKLPPVVGRNTQRLSATSHWIVAIETPHGLVEILAFHAGPPVFDGPDDRNGWRNHDEIAIWQPVLDGLFGPVSEQFVIIGNANLDVTDGEGRKDALIALLSDSRLQDPMPKRLNTPTITIGTRGDPALHTVVWPHPGPGPRRVSYILPSQRFLVAESGIFWPPDDDRHRQLVETASRHRLVWVDLMIP